MTKQLAKVNTVKQRKRRIDAKVNIDKAIEMKLKGISYEDIGKYYGVSKVAVFKTLEKYLDREISLEAFKRHRGDILANKQAQLLLSLTKDTIKEMTGQSLATAFGILYDKERIEKGESTAIISYTDHTKSLADIEKEIAEERAKIIDVTPQEQ